MRIIRRTTSNLTRGSIQTLRGSIQTLRGPSHKPHIRIARLSHRRSKRLNHQAEIDPSRVALYTLSALTSCTLFLNYLSSAHHSDQQDDAHDLELSENDIKRQTVVAHVQQLLAEYGQLAIELTDNEIDQLMRLVGNDYTTPEARDEPTTVNIHFDIKRSISRVMSWQLLFETDEDTAYQLFVKDQPADSRLPFDAFQRLAQQAKSLSPEDQSVQRTIALLTLSKETLAVFSEHGLPHNTDSETFLTDMVDCLISARRQNAPHADRLMPATNDLTLEQLERLHIAFLRDTHLRHMMYSEGGANMIKVLRTAITNKSLTKAQFIHWKMRWLVNLCGFSAGTGAAYLTPTTFELYEVIVSELECCFDDSQHQPLRNYLLQRADQAGYQPRIQQSVVTLLSSFVIRPYRPSTKIKQLFGHLVAMLDTTDAQTGAQIQEGLENYLRDARESRLLDAYDTFITNEDVITPTYVPAVYKSAVNDFKKRGYSSENSVKLATKFMCQVLTAIHNQDLTQTRIPCRDLGWAPNLEPHIQHWLLNNQEMTFDLHPDTGELTPTYVMPTPNLSNR